MTDKLTSLPPGSGEDDRWADRDSTEGRDEDSCIVPPDFCGVREANVIQLHQRSLVAGRQVQGQSVEVASFPK